MENILSGSSYILIIGVLIFIQTVMLFALITKSSREIEIRAYVQVIFVSLREVMRTMKTIKTDMESEDMDDFLAAVKEDFSVKTEVIVPDELKKLDPGPVRDLNEQKVVNNKVEDMFRQMPDDMRDQLTELITQMMKTKK